MKKALYLLPIFALACLRAIPVQAAAVTLNPTADAFVTTGPTNSLTRNNYGAAGALGVAAPGSARGEFQSVLQFDLSSARASFDSQFGAGHWSIQSITLFLTATSPNNAIFNPSTAGAFVISWMQNDSWVEGTGTPGAPATTGITFSSLPSFTGAGDESLGSFGFNGATSGSFSYSLALTSGFDTDATAGNLISLRLLAADNSIAALFDSRNFGTASARPLLSIVAVPEPGMVALLGLAAMLSAANRAKRHEEPSA